MRLARSPYHSALKPDLQVSLELDHFEAGGNVVFRMDLVDGPDYSQFSACDLIYAEPAWKDGYDVFARRAGTVEGRFQDYLEAIGGAIEHFIGCGVPVVLLAGTAMVKKLPTPSAVRTVKLHNYPSVLAGWGHELEVVRDGCDSFSAIAALADRHQRVGDFCCGYGNTGRIFAAAGRQFVMSDHNRRCIAYVAQNIMGWTP